MPTKAVFLDRDNTLIEDPGYLANPDGVRLLPGVELALKSLSQAGYQLVVVTNQSGIARGLLTEDTLKKIHERMVDMLSRKGAHIDEIYYCPYFVEGTVPEYSIESDLCKPEPGMLLQAADDLDLDLSACWMVGDSSRDIEAGQRSGCRTIRIRTPHGDDVADDQHEDFQADFTVRNLVEAARVVLRNRDVAPVITSDDADDDVVLNLGNVSAAGAPDSRTGVALAPLPTEVDDEPDDPDDDEPDDEDVDEDVDVDEHDEDDDDEADEVSPTAPTVVLASAASTPKTTAAAGARPAAAGPDPDIVRREILQEVRQMSRTQGEEEFSFWRLAGSIVQMLVVLTLGLTLMHLFGSEGDLAKAQVWGTVTVALQVMALTLAMLRNRR